jgi:PilZ domain-containing protein
LTLQHAADIVVMVQTAMPKMEHITGVINGIDWRAVRRFPRYSIDAAVRVSVVKNSQKHLFSGRGSELSEAGMAAYIPAELNLGDRVSIDMMLPYSREALSLVGIVRNRSGFRYGMEFKDITESQRESIRRTCSALALL